MATTTPRSSSPSGAAARFAHSEHDAEWDLVFDGEGKGGEAAEEQEELMLECKEHCQSLLTLVSKEMLKFELKKEAVDMSRLSSTSACDARCKPIVAGQTHRARRGFTSPP